MRGKGTGRQTVVVAATSLLLTFFASATAEASPRCQPGMAKVRVQQRTAWCSQHRSERVVSAVVTSRPADAVAFVTQNTGLGMRLVVVLLGAEYSLHTMTWPLPSSRDDSTLAEPVVTWLGKRRVGFGLSEVRPHLIASWNLRFR